MMEYIALIVISCAFISPNDAVRREDKPWGITYRDEYCDYETFKAQCNAGHIIMVQSAIFGHMKLGKCIKADIGFLGCKASVIDILDAKCSGKQSCEIAVDDESLRAVQPCVPGIDEYLEATYTCVKSMSLDTLCNVLTAKSRPSYITSVQMFTSHCSNHNGFRVNAERGQGVELTIINPSTDVPVSSQEIGYIIDGDSGDTIPMTLTDAEEIKIGISKSSSITIMLGVEHERTKFLIAFQAVGCADITPPPGTNIERDGDVANVVCSYTLMSWKLTCRNGRWLGVIGNCSLPVPSTTTLPVLPPTATEQLALQKDVIYVIVICATIFLSVLVITVGYVCLKRAKILQKQEPKNEWDQGTTKMILLPKPRPSSDYLTPRFNPDGESQQTQIYDTPLPDPPLVNTGTRPSIKRNNEEEFNNTMSSNSTDYTRKYFVLDQDYMNTKNLIDA